MKSPTLSRRAVALLALVSALVLFVAVNVIANTLLGTTRIDLTQGKLYTLSAGTKATLAKLDEPIVMRFYYSPKLGSEIPSYGVYAQRVREMLEEYAAASKGKIQLQILDPEPFSPVEDRAVALGLQGVPLDQGGEQVYFGLAATNSTDDQQTIPFFQPEREAFLEYDLTKLVHSLAFPKKAVLGLITELPLQGDIMAAMRGQPMVPYVVMEQLQQLYDVKTLSSDLDAVPADVDVLMVAQPQNLPEKTLYAIDQFVLKGGRALVFVDPHSETQQMHPSQLNPPGSPLNSDMPKLFKAWGLEMVPGMIAGDLDNARKVNAGTEEHVQAVDYVAWLNLKKSDFNPDDMITADLSHINMASAGILQPLPKATTKFTPLISTSTDSMEIPVAKVAGQVPDVAGMRNDFKSDDKRLVLAAHITGTADTAFPDGPPKPVKPAAATPPAAPGATPAAAPVLAAPAPATPPGPPQIKVSTQPINVVVVADTDILEDRFWVQTQDFFGQRVAMPTANNGDFVSDAVDVLAGGNDLISLRSRGTSVRPFVLVQNIQRAADARYQASEKNLEQELKNTQTKIAALRDDKGGSSTVALAAQQEKAIDNFRSEMITIRQQLRKVQLALREDIDRLEGWLEFFDIAFIPILVGLAAMVLGILRLRRRKRRAGVVR